MLFQLLTSIFVVNKRKEVWINKATDPLLSNAHLNIITVDVFKTFHERLEFANYVREARNYFFNDKLGWFCIESNV